MIGIGIGIPFIRPTSGGGGNTPRVAAFLTATGITDATIISALNTMDNDLISAGLLPSGTGAGKIKALYPFVGGSASTHKYNFVDPRDLDAAYRLSFNGGWTHSATGALPNGTNTFANTFINNSVINNTDLHLSFYSRTNNQTVGYDFAVDNSNLNLICRYASSINGYTSYDGFDNFTVTDSIGLYALSFNVDNLKGYKNNTNVINKTKTPISFSSANMYLCADNRGGSPTEFSTKECAFASFGLALSDIQHSALNAINTTFQTALGRNV